ncbi:MAG TPA: glucan biosynthesis protein G [Burkholderiales bacterium]|nr:glucan biosynthesis protein G [Burkholderiales bacterium]
MINSIRRQGGLLSGLSFALAAVAVLSIGHTAAAFAFDFSDVSQRARQLAEKPFRDEPPNLPPELQKLTYQQYWDIRYKADRHLWRGTRLPFEIAFFHRGSRFARPVRINVISADGVRPIKFDPADFDYGTTPVDPQKLSGLGFAGFRVHYPLNTTKYKDEVLSFLGASYFRALGRGQKYGLSARGVAVDTALMSGEEFPRFVEFWIEHPSPGAKELKIYGLLDSRRLTGAYQFLVRPGNETVVEVRARLYLREKVEKLGIAPLTSMYFYGENQPAPTEDIRPEVHDSDGLSVHTGTGEWLWRPLVNPRRLVVTSFSVTNPQGFGLMQRDRVFSSYQDPHMRYELRPSVWVEPRDKWGEGRVELVQIPTPDETNDNIVAFWVPAALPPKPPYSFEYRLRWQRNTETRPPHAWVMQTRRGRATTRKPDNTVGFTVDFVGPALEYLPEDAKLEGVVSVDANAEIVERTAFRNAATDGWRLAFRVRRLDEKKPVELRAYLTSGGEPMSEIWTYILPPT